MLSNTDHPRVAAATFTLATLARYSAVGLITAALAACGGGGGSPGTATGAGLGTPTPTTPVPAVPAAPTVTLGFVNASGQVSNSLSASTPLAAKATVKDKDGKPVPNALVAFATDNTLAVFSPSVGTALTDVNGVASVTMRPPTLAAGGAAKMTATADVAGVSIVGVASFSVGPTALTLSTLSLTPAAIAAYGTTTLSVDVLAAGVLYDEPQLVTFSSACVAIGKATLATSATTSNGNAKAVYRDLGCATRDTITASVQGASAPVSTLLTIAVPAPASVQFSFAAPTDKSIVIKGQGGIGRTETATLKFKVFDILNNPLSGQAVSFKRIPESADVTVNKVSDITDQNGEVITTVNSGASATAFRVQASLVSGISTLSDSIVVTTGLPIQRAFSLSVTTSNIEGWNYDSGTSTPAGSVNVLLADQFGNPVPDGAPVVFQSNLGAVGSAGKGGCNTFNGGCSVDLRTQDPRSHAPNTPATVCNNYGAGGAGMDDSTRAGVATICASSTDATSTVFKKIALFFSGSAASKVYLNGVTPLTGAVTDLGTVASIDAKVFNLLISDINENPMPAGTKIAIANINNGNALGVAPAEVQNIFPHSPSGDDPTGNVISGNQGSYHTITIGSTQPKPCVGPEVSNFNVNITTPKLVTTTYPFKVTFSCP